MTLNQIPINTRTHADIQFFSEVSPILLILRISTGQRFRRERSVDDASIGCILEGIECLNSV